MHYGGKDLKGDFLVLRDLVGVIILVWILEDLILLDIDEVLNEIEETNDS